MGVISISSLSPSVQFKVQTTDYVGPMDLMVYLIHKRELEVSSISLSAIASDFLSWFEATPNPELDHIGDFLLLAAILVDYKFRALFNQTEEQDTSVEITEHIREYSHQDLQSLNRQVKILSTLEEKQLYLFDRGTVQVEGLEEEITDFILSEVSLYDIALAFRNLLERLPTQQPYTVESSIYSIEGQIEFVLTQLMDRQSLNFEDLAQKLDTRLAVIMTFLAVLELLRVGSIRVLQEQPFGQFFIVKTFPTKPADK